MTKRQFSQLGDLLPQPLDREMRDPQFEKAGRKDDYLSTASHPRDTMMTMTDDEVLDEARAEGFELIGRMSAAANGQSVGRVVTTTGGRATSRSEAINWMRDRLSRGRVFV